MFLSIISAGIDRVDDLLDEVFRESCSCVDVGLCCVDTTTASMRTGLRAVVLDGHLRLAVGTEVVEHAVAPRSDSPRTSLCASMIGSGISSVGLRAGKAEHQALVAGAAGVHALTDVARLLVNRRQHRAGLGVEAELGARVADVA